MDDVKNVFDISDETIIGTAITVGVYASCRVT